MRQAYYILTELINAIRLDEIRLDDAVDILERVLVILDGEKLSEDEMKDLIFKLRGEAA